MREDTGNQILSASGGPSLSQDDIFRLMNPYAAEAVNFTVFCRTENLV